MARVCHVSRRGASAKASSMGPKGYAVRVLASGDSEQLNPLQLCFRLLSSHGVSQDAICLVWTRLPQRSLWFRVAICSFSRCSSCCPSAARSVIAAATGVTSPMRRLAILAVLLASCLAPAVALQSFAARSAPASSAPRLVAFRGHFGGFHLGGGAFGRRGSRFGGFGRRNSSRGILHRIARALAFAYLLHLFFSHGGLSILLWLLVIGLVVHFVRRRRRRPRDQYSY